MKQVFLSAIISLVTGACFTLGVVAVLVLAEAWNSGALNRSPEGEWVKQPAGLEVVEHRRIENTPEFTIHGVIENSGDSTWAQVTVVATILAGQSRMNECDTSLWGSFRPGERRAFQIECYRVAGVGTPDNIVYTVEVGGGRTGS